MPKDWREITSDELLNYDGAITAEIARYDRIVTMKNAIELSNVSNGLFDLKKAIHFSTDKLEARLLEAEKIQKEAASSQTKLQRVAIGLTVVIALATVVYTFITWQSVEAQREANQIQRESRAADATPKQPIERVVPPAR